jgi:hypothetical protein
MRVPVVVAALTAVGAGWVAWPPAPRAAEPVPPFQGQIAPLLTARCLRCHSGTGPKGKLDLSTRTAMLRGGKTGPAVVPGQAGGSLLFRRVRDKEMPPNGKPLTESELQRLRGWIEAGARWEGPALSRPQSEELRAGLDWWSLQPIQRPPLPAVPAGAPVHNPIDAFVLARLRARHLSPAEEADRRTYIRRVTLDLIGLLPAPEEVEAFVTDKAPDAYERLADRLLASPHYGERWGQHWLDVARFAESSGYENNKPRENAWPYRDYVIRSFNEDKPYDRFLREQLAGDAVADGDPLVDAATGFLVAGPTDLNVTQIPAARLQQRMNDLDDMIATAGSAFLGLTVHCARCHDHKFDPITQKDYYGLQAVLTGVWHDERPWRDGAFERRRREEEQLRAALAALYRKIDDREPLAGERGSPPRRPPVNARRNVERLAPVRAKYVRMVISATAGGDNPGLDEFEVFSADPVPRNLALASAGAKETASSRMGERTRIKYLNDGRYGDSRSWASGSPGKGWVMIEFPRSATIERVVWGRDREGKRVNRLASDYAIEVSTDGKDWKAVAGSWDRLPARKPGSGPAPTRPAEAETAKPEGSEWLEQVDRLEKRRAEVLEGPTVYAGTFRLPGPAYVLKAGDPTLPGESVGPSAIRALGRPLPADSRTPEQQRRLALVEWITDEHNPLPDRVVVNRLWHYHFGQGLVRTPSDFGFNGDRPSHPELLDWLAAEFRAHGRRLKPLHRLVVLSGTYRQASRSDPGAQAVDADCRLLWRYPPRRMEAEAIRDCLLQVSGSLDRRMGGPGYHLWQYGPTAVVQYTPRENLEPDAFRRMVYQFRPRIHRDGTFGAFDCPDASLPTPRRTVSTTALQALNLLNSPFVLGQSERWARRLAREAGGDATAQVRRAFALAFGREPLAVERNASVNLVRTHGLTLFCRTLFNANEFVYVH